MSIWRALQTLGQRYQMSCDDHSFENPENHCKGKWNRLILIQNHEPRFAELQKQFLDGWTHPKKEKPEIRAIFKILSSKQSLSPYLEHRTKVSISFFVKFFSRTVGNEQLLFHGTTRCCRLGEDTSSVYLCDVPDCLLCNVIRKSYDVDRCGMKNKFRRFGTGIYSTSCSSKADDYSQNTSPKAKLRVLLVNRVVVGRPYRLRRNAISMTEAPPGYHSVIGEPGEDLNYEETVVYSNDAIRPAYLIVYGDPQPEAPPSKVQGVLKALFSTPLAS
ncbi:hypothetical protein AMATHDRAFT_5871 [Amanita thiersii Skay4041]|uniref:PARP catalytic domain-containing protein n=1 Tax=Amanita thiersii Skay4041 TaxID=703135 RepID=A0A2A9NEA7_9AGAR|nr:hypothetical protein AMATHDRAFT_5871 [Amanita thiersii Skay4041]